MIEPLNFKLSIIDALSRKARAVAHELCPPVLRTFLRPGIVYDGAYASWSEAKAASSGYDAPLILEKVSAAVEQVAAGNAAYERDSVLFFEQEFNWPLVSAMLLAARKLSAEQPLRILDFGGSLGSSYFQNRNALPKDMALNWTVLEQPEFVKRGAERFANEQLRFSNSPEECVQPDLLLLCSVLQYLPEPWAMLERLLKLKPRFIFLERTPFLQDAQANDRLCVQHVPPCICEAAYPVWMLSAQRFEAILGASYEKLADFTTMGGCISLSSPKGEALERGCVWRRKDSAHSKLAGEIHD